MPRVTFGSSQQDRMPNFAKPGDTDVCYIILCAFLSLCWKYFTAEGGDGGGRKEGESRRGGETEEHGHLPVCLRCWGARPLHCFILGGASEKSQAGQSSASANSASSLGRLMPTIYFQSSLKDSERPGKCFSVRPSGPWTFAATDQTHKAQQSAEATLEMHPHPGKRKTMTRSGAPLQPRGSGPSLGKGPG